ncbi:MAG TPA: GNAT family N-acetyltransferase [Actinospica sp.]|nr:GNAT family N-acetyltransferase [Actinospica sp.]
MAREAWVRAATIEEFGRETIPALAMAPVANTQLLTVFDRLRREGPRAFGERDPQLLTWYGPHGTVEAALLRTPPHPYIVAGEPGPAGLAALAGLLLDPASGLDGTEINLPATGQAAFTQAWTARAGRPPRETERDRLYRLAELRYPEPMPPGRARLAAPADLPVVVRFLAEFWIQAERVAPREVAMIAQRTGASRIAEGDFLLWLDAAGQPVSSAGCTPIVAGSGRIGPVYTPPGLRGRGYAGAVTAAAGRLLLDRGAAQVLLFADLANRTSNALYQRIGYRAVSDRVRMDLRDRPGAEPPAGPHPPS